MKPLKIHGKLQDTAMKYRGYVPVYWELAGAVTNFALAMTEVAYDEIRDIMRARRSYEQHRYDDTKSGAFILGSLVIISILLWWFQ